MCERLKPDKDNLECNHRADLFCLMCINTVDFNLYRSAYETISEYLDYLQDHKLKEIKAKLELIFLSKN